MQASDQPIRIGGSVPALDVMHGAIDDLRFYRAALTAGQIAELASPSSTATTDAEADSLSLAGNG